MDWIGIDRMRAQGYVGAANMQGFTEVSKQLSGIARWALAEGESPNNREDTLSFTSEDLYLNVAYRADHSPHHASVHCYTREII